jgi:predicted hydrocarbon binding protein
MQAADISLQRDLVFDLESGMVHFGSQRMVIMSAGSFGKLLWEMIDIGGQRLAQVLLRRFGEAAGRDDARLLKSEFNPDTDFDWIAMGPTIHTWEGIVKATPTVLEYDRAAGKMFMQGKWENSFFAEQYVRLFGPAKQPVCWMLSGYATGYVSEFMGSEMLCKETMCVAQGDPYCQFTIKPKGEWD